MHVRCKSLLLSRGALVAGSCVALAGMPAAAGAQDDRSGVYAGLQLGIARSSVIESSLSGVSQPTRCDVLLYPPPAAAPAGDPACLDTTPVAILSNDFDPGAGMAGGLTVGYMAGVLRFEMEYLHRYVGDDTSPVRGVGNPAIRDKDVEWPSDLPPYEWIGDFSAHQVFANAYYDFLNDSSWTPYAGAGVGWAATNVSYYSQFIRKPDADYLQVEFDPDWPEAARRTAAGTASIIDTKAGKNVFGFQVLAGVDYALSERTSVGVAYRWARFDDVADEVVPSSVVIRSHAAVLADGVTPFTSDLEFSDIGYQAVTVNLKYRF